MTQTDYSAFWRAKADADWRAAQHLAADGSPLHSLPMALWALEKLSNAHWVLAHAAGTLPPRTALAARWQATPLRPSAAHLATVAALEGCYESCLYRPLPGAVPTAPTPAGAARLLAEAAAVRTWLLSTLPEKE